MLETWVRNEEAVTELLEAQADAFGAGFFVVDSNGMLILYNERFALQWAIPPSVLAPRSLPALVEWLSANGGDAGKRLATLLLSREPPVLW
jgi:hypothetical protein